MTNIMSYIKGEQPQMTDVELQKLAKTASRHTMIGTELYKGGFLAHLPQMHIRRSGGVNTSPTNKVPTGGD